MLMFQGSFDLPLWTMATATNSKTLLPQICLAAALSLGTIRDILSAFLSLVIARRAAQQLSRALQLGAHLSDIPFVACAGLLAHMDDCLLHSCTGLLAVMLVVSLSRTGALLRNYSAPMAVFRALPEARVLQCTAPVHVLLVSSD